MMKQRSIVLLLLIFLAPSYSFLILPNNPALGSAHTTKVHQRPRRRSRSTFSSHPWIPLQVGTIYSCSNVPAPSAVGTLLVPQAPEKRRNRKQQQSSSTKAKTRTLYDILGASPRDSKSELKQKYVALAKQTHPDAFMATAKSTTTASSNIVLPEFTEIAAAWRILSNERERQRYDRQRQAAVLVQLICFGANLCWHTTLTALEIITVLLVTVLAPLVPAILSALAELGSLLWVLLVGTTTATKERASSL